MKSYYTLAWREIKGQRLVSFLIIIAMVLSTMMTTAAGQSAGILKAMREQQAITIGGDRYASFVQLTEEQAQALERDERFSYTGRYIQLSTGAMGFAPVRHTQNWWRDGCPKIRWKLHCRRRHCSFWGLQGALETQFPSHSPKPCGMVLW